MLQFGGVGAAGVGDVELVGDISSLCKRSESMMYRQVCEDGAVLQLNTRSVAEVNHIPTVAPPHIGDVMTRTMAAAAHVPRGLYVSIDDKPGECL